MKFICNMMELGEQVRADFPLLSQKVYGRPLVYLDNAATTQKPHAVINKLTEVYTSYNANIHRGVHHLSQVATAAHEDARKMVANFLHAHSEEEITFTRGTTEAINLVAQCYGEQFVNEGDEIIVSTHEHHSNIVPWQILCQRKHATLRVIPLLSNGELDMQAYAGLLNERTRMVSVAHVSNVLGVVNPVEDIIRLAHANGTPVLIDGAQSVAHMPINLQQLDADFFVFSGHKIYAPTGIGVLYGKAHWLNAMPPYQGGGEMISTVTFEKTTYNQLPYKFEAGTPDYAGSIALAEALCYLTSLGMERVAEYEHELLHYAEQRLNEIPQIRILAAPSQRSGAISFLLGSQHPYDVGMLLDKLGVAVRTGHHCAQPLIDYYGIPGTVRISLAIYTTKQDIDAFIAALRQVADMLL